MRGKLIIIESGSDASGKATQTEKLFKRLVSENYKVKKITFLTMKVILLLGKMYLNGDLVKTQGCNHM